MNVLFCIHPGPHLHRPASFHRIATTTPDVERGSAREHVGREDEGTAPQPGFPAIIEEALGCVEQVRHSIVEVYASIALDHRCPEAVAQRLGISANLRAPWSHMIAAPDARAMLRYVPWQKGFSAADAAFRRAGVSKTTLDALTSRVQRFGEIMRDAGGRLRFESRLTETGFIQPLPRVEAESGFLTGDSEMAKARRRELLLVICGASILVLILVFMPSPKDPTGKRYYASIIPALILSAGYLIYSMLRGVGSLMIKLRRTSRRQMESARA